MQWEYMKAEIENARSRFVDKRFNFLTSSVPRFRRGGGLVLVHASINIAHPVRDISFAEYFSFITERYKRRYSLKHLDRAGIQSTLVMVEWRCPVILFPGSPSRLLLELTEEKTSGPEAGLGRPGYPLAPCKKFLSHQRLGRYEPNEQAFPPTTASFNEKAPG